MKQPILSMLEIKDGALFINGTELTAVSFYELKHSNPGATALTVTMDVMLKGQDDWILEQIQH